VQHRWSSRNDGLTRFVALHHVTGCGMMARPPEWGH